MLTGKQLDNALALDQLGRCDKPRKPCDQFRGAGCADWCVCGYHKSMHCDKGKISRMTTATGKTTVRQDALAQIAKAVKDGSADSARESVEFGNNRRQRTETGAGAVVTECDCPARTCQPEKNVGKVCWRSRFDIRASDFPDAVPGGPHD